MSTLILDTVLTGHHIEYLNLIYHGAIKRKNEKFVFAVPEMEWNSMKDTCQWPKADNIHLHMLNQEECIDCGKGSMISQNWKLSKLIKRTALKYNASAIKLISLAGAVPLLPLILPANIKLSGIIYKIYLRAPKKSLRKFIDYLRYSIMAHNRSMDKIYILNDPRSTIKLNKFYHTDRFIPLSDPVPEVDMASLVDIRSQLSIPIDSKVYLHFGAMDERKGTLEILRAIVMMSRVELNKRTFIFAGRVGKDIKEKFYNLADNAREKGATIIIKDEFCSFDYLHSLCHICNCILIPYLLTDLSSGALGYAAVHGKPVIGPSSGLIGELIEDNNLGETMNEVTPKNIKEKILNISDNIYKTSYTEKNSRNSFITTFLS